MARLDPPSTSSTVLGHLPEALHAFERLYATLWRSRVLDPVTKELARIRNARTTDCGY